MNRAIALCVIAGLVSACNPVVPDSTAHQTTTTSSALPSNWEVKEVKLADNRWSLDMRMSRWTTGGDGEAIELLHRHAERLADLHGYRSYRILSWDEGIQSDMPIAQRWARGVVVLEGYMPPMPEEKPAQ